ncbi:MAG: hypothetical protein KYQ20_02365 [Candidatus Nealsonbacteria bacterium]|nr:hypothetical protein [Candidatus Nealsonbacteria bacterium]
MLKKKKLKKEITLNDLAAMIGRGFNEAQEDRGKIKQDVSGLKQDVSGLREDIEDIKYKLSSLERRIMFLEDKATEHSKELRNIKEMFQKAQQERKVDRQKIVWLEKRVERLEAKVGI